MADPVRAAPPKRGLAAIVGAAAAASLLVLVPAREGTITKTYKDVGGVLTYCTGATENAQAGKTYTLPECRAQLDRDLVRHAEGVMACLKVPTTDGQRVAFVDLAYNIGTSGFCGSTAARKTNAGDSVGGCNAVMLWNRVQGVEIRGLTNRREAERQICLKGLK